MNYYRYETLINFEKLDINLYRISEMDRAKGLRFTLIDSKGDIKNEIK